MFCYRFEMDLLNLIRTGVIRTLGFARTVPVNVYRHITSDKLGGDRLMIQSAWENQVQNISVEHPRVGGAVLDNPAIEVGGFPVAKSTVLWWEQVGKVPSGTAARAPVIQ